MRQNLLPASNDPGIAGYLKSAPSADHISRSAA
jgi:hypothetical protein